MNLKGKERERGKKEGRERMELRWKRWNKIRQGKDRLQTNH
jgi:hypothetical protein